MIKGTGIDITDVSRVKKFIENDKFLNKVYTKEEQDYLKKRKNNPETAAGLFAAKEAISKCLGTGFENFGPKDIEILKDEKGKPYVRLMNNALKRAEDINITKFHLSISHTKEYAVASCIGEGIKE